MTPIDLLVLGGSGFIGGRVAQAAQSAGLATAVTRLSRPSPADLPAYPLDLCDLPAVRDCLERTRPRAIIHCAVTYTMSTTFDESAQMRVSAETVRVLLEALRSLNLAPRLVYVSTNAVFSGKHGPYRESDQPDPLERTDAYRFYGQARCTGEELTLGGADDALVVRTANVDGLDAWGQLNPRLAGLLSQLRGGKELARYVDRFLSPTLVDTVAQALVEVVQPGFALPERRILHVAGRQAVSDYEYARRLAERVGVPKGLVKTDHYLPPGEPGQYNIALDVSYTQSLLKTRMLTVEEMLDILLPF